MKKILWMSRHKLHPRQIETLREMYGKDTIVEQESRPFDDARVVARRFREGGFDDMVIVAPLSVIAVLCNEGIKMLWSEAVGEKIIPAVTPATKRANKTASKIWFCI